MFVTSFGFGHLELAIQSPDLQDDPQMKLFSLQLPAFHFRFLPEPHAPGQRPFEMKGKILPAGESLLEAGPGTDLSALLEKARALEEIWRLVCLYCGPDNVAGIVEEVRRLSRRNDELKTALRAFATVDERAWRGDEWDAAVRRAQELTE